MTTTELLEKIDIPRHKLYYLEQKGYINPKRHSMGELEVREFSQADFEKVKIIWKYLRQGFKHKIAYQKAMEEMSVEEKAKN